MKKLSVPLFLQAKNSFDCGPTCIRMVFSYYGIEKSLKELQSKLTYDEVGTSAYDNGTLLLNEGLNVSAITAQPLLFSPDTVPTLKKKEDIIRLLLGKEKEELKRLEKDKWVIQSMRNFLQKGGDLRIEIPTFSHIKKAIDDNYPVLVAMYAKSVGSKEGGFHFVVVCGYKDGHVYVNNPKPDSIRQGWYPVEEFLYGVYAATCVSFDNGTFLVPSKS